MDEKINFQQRHLNILKRANFPERMTQLRVYFLHEANFC